MSSRQGHFDDYYFDSVGSQCSPHPSRTIWEHLNQPALIVSGLVLLVTVLYNIYGSSEAFEDLALSLISPVWNAIVCMTPSQLLFAVDNWIEPQMIGTQTNTHASKSAAMQRILGLDRRRGMMASVFQARNRALSITGSALGLSVDTSRPAGLGNRDNSCFQNSILQGLASLQPLPDYLSTCLQNADIDRDDASRVVTQTLRTLLSDLNDSSNNGRTLWTPNKLKFLSTWTQQDAQEYFSKILDDIDKGAAKALKTTKRQSGFESDTGKDEAAASQHSDDSGYQSLSGSSRASDAVSFRNPLEGLLAQRVSCVQCGHSDGLSMIPFNCLTLSLGLKGRHDLYERLDAYSGVEAIEGVECAKCTLLKAQRLLTKLVEQMRDKGSSEEQLAEPMRRLEAVELALEEDQFDEKTLVNDCKISGQGRVNTTKTKQIVIARPPQSLAIHVNRSVFDPNTFNMIKNSAPVNFPMTLDLGPWCLGSADEVGESDSPETGQAGTSSEERWMQDPTASMIAGDQRPSRLSGPIYELRAVVTHYGRHENGHYICYRRYPRGSMSPTHESNNSSVVDNNGDVGDESRADSPGEDRVENLEGAETGEWDWWRLSDHNVSKVDEHTVSSLSPGVFMLFYDCVDPSMVLQESNEESRSTAMEAQAQDATTGPDVSLPQPNAEKDAKPAEPAVPEQPAQAKPDGQDAGSAVAHPETVLLSSGADGSEKPRDTSNKVTRG